MNDPDSPPAGHGPAPRIVLIDALRGFALFGVLQINLQASVVGMAPFATVLRDGSGFDHALWLLITVLVTAKFYPIFAFLFGYGFQMQRQALECRGVPPADVLARRYGFLLVLGLAHGCLLFFGDILTVYGIAGFVLLATLRPGAAALRRLLQGWLLVSLIVVALIGVIAFGPPPPHVAEPWNARQRAAEFVQLLGIELPLFLPQVMLFFLCGATAARIGLLRHPHLHARLWQRLWRVGLWIGVPISVAFAVLKWLPMGLGISNPWVESAGSVANQWCALMSPAIVAAFVAWAGRAEVAGKGSWHGKALHGLAAAGRMALTNYLLQSLAMLVLLQLTGWGRTIGFATLAGLGLGLWLLQCLASAWWLRRWRMGPAEALWRRFTWARQPARAREARSAPRDRCASQEP